MAIISYIDIAKGRGCTLTAEQERKLAEYNTKKEQRTGLRDCAAGSIAPGIANAIFWGVIGIANSSAKKDYKEIAEKLESHDEKVKYEITAKRCNTAAKFCYTIAAASVGLPIVATVASQTAVAINNHSAHKYIDSIMGNNNGTETEN